MGTPKEPREIKLRRSLTFKEQKKCISLLREFIDIFAWSYKDMLGIDRDIAEHKIPPYLDAKPVK